MRTAEWNPSVHLPNLVEWASRDDGIKEMLGTEPREDILNQMMPVKNVLVNGKGEVMALLGVNLYAPGMASCNVIPSPDFRKMKNLEEAVQIVFGQARVMGAKTAMLVMSKDEKGLQEAARRQGAKEIPSVQMVKVL